MPPSDQSVLAAALVATTFWTVIGSDDRPAIGQLLSSTWDGRPDDFAALYLRDRKLDPETCRFMGLSTSVDVLADDRLRFWFIPTDRTENIAAGKAVTMWPLELVYEAATWRVDRTSDRQEVGHVDLFPYLGRSDLPEPPRAN